MGHRQSSPMLPDIIRNKVFNSTLSSCVYNPEVASRFFGIDIAQTFKHCQTSLWPFDEFLAF
jgi:hypothetical protein